MCAYVCDQVLFRQNKHFCCQFPDSGIAPHHSLLYRNTLWGFLVVIAPLVSLPTFSLLQVKTET